MAGATSKFIWEAMGSIPVGNSDFFFVRVYARGDKRTFNLHHKCGLLTLSHAIFHITTEQYMYAPRPLKVHLVTTDLLLYSEILMETGVHYNTIPVQI